MKKVLSALIIAVILIGMLPMLAIPVTAATITPWSMPKNGKEILLSTNCTSYTNGTITSVDEKIYFSFIPKITGPYLFEVDDYSSMVTELYHDTFGKTTEIDFFYPEESFCFIYLVKGEKYYFSVSFKNRNQLGTISVKLHDVSGYQGVCPKCLLDAPYGEGEFFYENQDIDTHRGENGKLFVVGKGNFLKEFEPPLWHVISDYPKFTSVFFDEGIENIPANFFAWCSSIKEVYLSNSITSIGDWAFYFCSGIETIHIPANVKEIGYGAFAGCSSLKKFTVDPENPYYYADSNGVLYEKGDGDALVVAPGGLKGSYTVKKGCIGIGSIAFFNCLNLEEIILPSSVQIIGSWAFEKSGIKKIQIPASLTRINEGAFYGCSSFKNVQYCGTKNQKTKIKIESKNDILKNAKWSYHKYTNVCDKTCNVCKARRTAPHSYTNACDKSCNYCSATRNISHTYKKVTTKATMAKDGKIQNKCSVCGYVASKTTTIKKIKTVKLSTTTYTYNGSVKTPSVTVKDSAGKTLKKNTDYTVTYASGRKNVGTYKVTVKMIGKYSGTKTLTFKIIPVSVTKCTAKLSTTVYTYNGKLKAPAVTMKYAGKTLKKGTDYTVTYAKGRKNVGTYKVTIKMKGNYSGTKTLTFKIIPAATKVSKLTAGKKSITVAITKKTAQVTGYQIQYSTSKAFSKATTKTISSYKTTKYSLKSLSAKKTYYVRVRTYKTVGKTKYYSAWSTYKYVKTK